MRRHSSQETGFYPSPTRSCGSWSLEWLEELRMMPPSRNSEFCICKSKSSYKNSGLKSYWIAEYILLLESLLSPTEGILALAENPERFYAVSLVSKQGWWAVLDRWGGLLSHGLFMSPNVLFTVTSLGTEGKKSQPKWYLSCSELITSIFQTWGCNCQHLTFLESKHLKLLVCPWTVSLMKSKGAPLCFTNSAKYRIIYYYQDFSPVVCFMQIPISFQN